MARLTGCQYGCSIVLGVAMGLISIHLGKLSMYALWLVVLVGWTTISARWQPFSTKGWWSSIVLWVVALVTYEFYLARLFAPLNYSLSWESLSLGLLLTAVVGVPVAYGWHRMIRGRRLSKTINT